MNALMDPVQTEAMKKAFAIFDQKKTGFIPTDCFPKIMKELGVICDEEELKTKVSDVDEDDEGKVDFDDFCRIALPLMEPEDNEAMNEELKEAFRLYDKKGEGFITTQVLKEILRELDPKLSADDLQSIVEEVDDDKSGTVDFEEFMEMMTG